MLKKNKVTYLFRDVKFTDGPEGPEQVELEGKVVPKKAFWEIYHEFNVLSKLEQNKLIVK